MPPREGRIVRVDIFALRFSRLKNPWHIPVPLDQVAVRPDLDAIVGRRPLAEDETVDATGHAKSSVDEETLVVFPGESFGRMSPCHHFRHLGPRKQAQDGKMLAAASGNLAAESVDGGSGNLAVLARAQTAGGFLNLPASALQVSSREDDVAPTAGVDHGIGVGQARGDWLVGGDPFHTRLGAGDHGLFHELSRRDHGGDVRRLVAQHPVHILVERFYAEALTHDSAPLVVEFGNRGKFGVGQPAIHLGEVLAHAPAADDADTQLLAAGCLFRRGEKTGGVAPSGAQGCHSV